jgi:hypothetical protein
MENLITRGRNVGTALCVREIKTRHVLGEICSGSTKRKIQREENESNTAQRWMQSTEEIREENRAETD